MSKLTVACVRVGEKYGEHYVSRLQSAVERNLSYPHEFVVLRDADCSWPGWWAKIELFRPRRFRGPVLYLDLDVVIVGSLDRLVRRPDRFCGLRTPSGINSSAMVWTPNATTDQIHTKFSQYAERVMESTPGGDQDWIASRVSDVLQLPGVHSFKADLGCGNPRPDTSVVIFHGRPKPDEVDLPWIHENWR